jgi:hypothetical protein
MRLTIAAVMVVACVCAFGAGRTQASAPMVRVTISCKTANAFDEDALRRIVVDALSRQQLGSRQLDVSVQLTHVGAGRHADVSAHLGVIVSDDRGAMQSRVSGGATVRVSARSLKAGAAQAVDTAIKGIAHPLRDHLAKR